MKQYKRQITLAELTEKAMRKGWTLDTRKHDLEGSDYVTLFWKQRNRVRVVLYSPWNGHFQVEDGTGKFITHNSPDGAAPWLDNLLEVLFTNEERAA